MTTFIETQHEFTATVKNIGAAQTGNGWAVTMNWMLPGSRYPQILTGQDWGQIANYKIGDNLTVVIDRGPLKSGKEGKYNTEYWWNATSINFADADPGQGEPLETGDDDLDFLEPHDTAPAQVTAPAQTAQRSGASSGQDFYRERDTKYLDGVHLGVAYNTAREIMLHNPQDYPSPVTHPVEWHYALRHLRDLLIDTGDIQAPAHYCTEHDVARRQGRTGQWGHSLGNDEWCME